MSEMSSAAPIQVSDRAWKALEGAYDLQIFTGKHRLRKTHSGDPGCTVSNRGNFGHAES